MNKINRYMKKVYHLVSILVITGLGIFVLFFSAYYNYGRRQNGDSLAQQMGLI